MASFEIENQEDREDRRECPECGDPAIRTAPPDADGWRFCPGCGAGRHWDRRRCAPVANPAATHDAAHDALDDYTPDADADADFDAECAESRWISEGCVE
jgi:ribosomal protein S27AE